MKKKLFILVIGLLAGCNPKNSSRNDPDRQTDLKDGKKDAKVEAKEVRENPNDPDRQTDLKDGKKDAKVEAQKARGNPNELDQQADLEDGKEDEYKDVAQGNRSDTLEIKEEDVKEQLMTYVKEDRIDLNKFQTLFNQLGDSDKQEVLQAALKEGSEQALRLCAQQGVALFEPILAFAREVGTSEDATQKEKILNYVRRIRLLAGQGYDILQTKNSHKQTLLHQALRYPGALRIILTAGKNLPVYYDRVEELAEWINACDTSRHTALHQAIINKDLDSVQCLVEEEKAELNVYGKEFFYQTEYALHTAARIGNLEIVKCLVEKGGATDKPNRNNKYTVDIARAAGHRVIADYLLNKFSDEEKKEAR